MTPPCQTTRMNGIEQIMEMPIHTDSPPKPVNSEGGDVERNIHHVCAQMKEFAKRDKHFRLMVEKKRMGEMLEASLKDEETVYKLILVLEKADITPSMACVESVKANTDTHSDKAKDPTVKPADTYATQDAEAIWEAMNAKCWGYFNIDVDAVMTVLAYRSYAHRREIEIAFDKSYRKKLQSILVRNLRNDSKTIVQGLFMSPADFDAMHINKAIKDPATCKKVFIELLFTRTNQQIKDFREAYKKKSGKDLKPKIKDYNSFHLNRLLDSLLNANRDESEEVDLKKAMQDAQKLLDAGVKKWVTDESRFNDMLVSSSYAQLRATFNEYATLANKDIDNTIQGEVSGDLQNTMLAIVRCIKSKASHFASELHRSMTGRGKDHNTVCRVIVSRFEVDMDEIKNEFQRNHNQTLGTFIADNTSGDYRTILLKLIREESANKKK